MTKDMKWCAEGGGGQSGVAAGSIWMSFLQCTHEWEQLNRSYHGDKQTGSTYVGAHTRNHTNTLDR